MVRLLRLKKLVPTHVILAGVARGSRALPAGGADTAGDAAALDALHLNPAEQAPPTGDLPAVQCASAGSAACRCLMPLLGRAGADNSPHLLSQRASRYEGEDDARGSAGAVAVPPTLPANHRHGVVSRCFERGGIERFLADNVAADDAADGTCSTTPGGSRCQVLYLVGSMKSALLERMPGGEGGEMR